jgi:CheY-like chemotaxis protein
MTNDVKILVVDDNKKFLAMLNEFLSDNGFDVEISDNGHEALKKFTDFIPDIVVTDIVMPDIDGIELLLQLRKTNPDVKVIVMSGGNRGHADAYLHMADKLGANSVLSKPFELEELMQTIKKLQAHN